MFHHLWDQAFAVAASGLCNPPPTHTQKSLGARALGLLAFWKACKTVLFWGGFGAVRARTKVEIPCPLEHKLFFIFNVGFIKLFVMSWTQSKTSVSSLAHAEAQVGGGGGAVTAC